jgi:hypothetical protein
MVVVLGVFSSNGLAQTPKEGKRAASAKDEVNALLPVESMIRQAAENVSRRYNLNREQTQFTQDILAKRVNKFLEEHEDEIWPIIRDMARYQNPKKKMDAATAQRLGKAVQPLFAKAQEAILEANQEWREVLSADQKKLHDYDLSEMDKTFKDMGGRFEGWSRGTVDDHQGIFPPERLDNPPVKPSMPKTDDAPAERVIKAKEEWWDGYVDNFIKDYALDEGQITSARSILKELKDRAMAYRTSHREDFQRIEQKLETARKAGDIDKLNQAVEEQKQLNLFLPQLFKELKDRLDAIPRPAQREKFEQSRKNFRWGDRQTAPPPASGPAPTEKRAETQPGQPSPQTQPAATSLPAAGAAGSPQTRPGPPRPGAGTATK